MGISNLSIDWIKYCNVSTFYNLIHIILIPDMTNDIQYRKNLENVIETKIEC